jgi:hypothetical protein
MTDTEFRIPDDRVAEVFAEAARLQADQTKGYSFADLQKACAEIQIPQSIVERAFLNVERRRSEAHQKRKLRQDFIRSQIKTGFSAGVKFILPTLLISGIFVFRSPIEYWAMDTFKSFLPKPRDPNASLQVLRVKSGELKYINGEKSLSIALRESSGYSTSGPSSGVIGTDGYKNLPIQFNVGDFYDYRGIFEYRIKIIAIGKDSVDFQIEKKTSQAVAEMKRFQEELDALQKENKKITDASMVSDQGLRQKIEFLEYQEKVLNEKIKELQSAPVRPPSAF